MSDSQAVTSTDSATASSMSSAENCVLFVFNLSSCQQSTLAHVSDIVVVVVVVVLVKFFNKICQTQSKRSQYKHTV